MKGTQQDWYNKISKCFTNTWDI